MQLLADELDEFGIHPGLGWIGGRVGPISEHVGTDVRIPHIGWARIDPVDGEAASFFGRNEKSNHFYFCHTNCLQTSAPAVAATVDLTTPVVAAVLKENVFAVQFHPEKSQLNGIRLIEAFLDWHALSATDADKSNHPQPVVARRAARERRSVRRTSRRGQSGNDRARAQRPGGR